MKTYQNYLKQIEEIVQFKVDLQMANKTVNIYDVKYNTKRGINSFYRVVGTVNNDVIGLFRLSQLPGCCGVLVSYNAEVCHKFCNKGIGSLLSQLRQSLARSAGYTVLLCTDVQDNLPQRKILEKNNFKTIHTFTNRRTNNVVNISVVDLLIEPNTERQIS